MSEPASVNPQEPRHQTLEHSYGKDSDVPPKDNRSGLDSKEKECCNRASD